MKIKTAKSIGVILVLGAVLTLLLSKKEQDTYVAHATFYYWFNGLEMSAGWREWSGPDPLCCFKKDLWDRRPRDFRWKVWRRFLRCRERDEKTAKQLFNEAYDSVAVSHAASALTWGNLYVTAREPEVAADVANAYMTALADLEMELLNERGNVIVRNYSLSYYRLLKRRLKLEQELSGNEERRDGTSANEKLELVRRQMMALDAKIATQEHVDNRTNTMFKIMHKAEVPTAASGSDSRKRMEEFRRWFESAGDIPL